MTGRVFERARGEFDSLRGRGSRGSRDGPGYPEQEPTRHEPSLKIFSRRNPCGTGQFPRGTMPCARPPRLRRLAHPSRRVAAKCQQWGGRRPIPAYSERAIPFV